MTTTRRPSMLILGTRGVPAAHGGFETFAERLALHLVERGWDVGVYCQRDVSAVTERFSSTYWRGIEQIHVEVASTGPAGTLDFDAHCVRDAADRDGVCLVLGYNGAVFLPYLRLAGSKIMTNMDGIEWRRPKWSRAVKAWFWINEWIAAWSSQRLVADHPVIADHIATRRPRKAIATIPYGGQEVLGAPLAPVEALGLTPGRYLISVARIEPDNSILPIVETFSRRPRGMTLAVLGRLDDANPYHRAVRAAAGGEVLFPGPIYDPPSLQALRFHARAYVHGHTVGGTNPSLVESLWAGNPVIAHANAYNAWTAGPEQLFFSDADDLDAAIATALGDDAWVARAGAAARVRASRDFAWSDILKAYEQELLVLGGYAAAPALAPVMDGALGLPAEEMVR
ncbi:MULTISPECIES: DUF1972 domain-containing protein [unclassified Methylobacterium]|uniref:DUF1972 domain-containing protein n=1 Tax=unclassified Methylobacterium TaxID=2615210 RepID=UPI0006F1F1B8|nr:MULTISPECIES: DUF1972 domain-containing protein [unclassified Methylobacterium]KQP60635.1 glycosyl transferase [Methylobacterium sp. Leaf108]KQT78387.1 glycosyl transferase [Methylobacterium sp. Leaf466]